MRLAFREAFAAFRRAPLLSALGIITIALSLFAFGLFGLVAINIRDALNRVEERVEIRAFVEDGTSVEVAASAMERIGEYPEVAQVVYVSKEEALERARRELGEFSDVFESEFLPASMDIHMRPGHRDPQAVRSVAARLEDFAFVEDVRYGHDWVQKLYDLRTVATVAGAGLGLAFAAVAIIIIGATIRTAVLARSREIWIMRLVGATDSFIRAPFLIEGSLKGVMGGLLALALTWLTHRAIDRNFVETAFFHTEMAMAGVLTGALIGLLGSLYSVGRHLRQV